MSAGELLPDGSMVTARIEVLEVIAPDGTPGLSWEAMDSSGDELDLTRLLGLIERAKVDIVVATVAPDEEDWP